MPDFSRLAGAAPRAGAAMRLKAGAARRQRPFLQSSVCGARIFNPNPKISRSPVDTDHRLQVPMFKTQLKVVVCLTP